MSWTETKIDCQSGLNETYCGFLEELKNASNIYRTFQRVYNMYTIYVQVFRVQNSLVNLRHVLASNHDDIPIY